MSFLIKIPSVLVKKRLLLCLVFINFVYVVFVNNWNIVSFSFGKGGQADFL
jgi:hypothetical protein